MTCEQFFSNFPHCGFLFLRNVKKPQIWAYIYYLDLYMQGEMRKTSPIMTEESLKSNSQTIPNII